jgi:hypothetical protein
MGPTRSRRSTRSSLVPGWARCCRWVWAGLYVSTSQAIENDARCAFRAHGAQRPGDARRAHQDLCRRAARNGQPVPHGDEVTRDAISPLRGRPRPANQFPGVESINFAHYVLDADRDRFEARCCKTSTDVGATRGSMPEGRRAEYTVLTFVEPGTVWIDRIGVDLHTKRACSSSPGAFARHGRSVDRGCSGEIRIGGNGPGDALAGVPAAMPLQDVTQRRAAYLGTVGIGFSVSSLAQGVLDNMPKNATRLVISGTSPVRNPAGRWLPPHRVVRQPSGCAPDEEAEFRALLPVGFGGADGTSISR